MITNCFLGCQALLLSVALIMYLARDCLLLASLLHVILLLLRYGGLSGGLSLNCPKLQPLW